MKDEKQLVLFFRNKDVIDNASLAARLKSKFDILKDPLVVPFNPNQPNQPLILFNQGDLKLAVNLNDISFVYNKELHSKLYDVIIDIVEF